MHRPKDFVGHYGGAGDCQKFTARSNGHYRLPLMILLTTLRGAHNCMTKRCGKAAKHSKM
jgi:hypothetical protein